MLPSDPHAGKLYYRIAIMCVVGYNSSSGFQAVTVGKGRTGYSSSFVTVSRGFYVGDKKAFDKAERERESARVRQSTRSPKRKKK